MSTWSARPLVMMVLSGLIAVSAIVALAATVVANVGGDDGDTADRNQIASRASDFAVAYNTYDVDDLADYQKRLKGLLTPEYNEQFVEITNAVFEALADKKQKSGDAEVLGVAIESLDGDSADVIIAVDSSITNTDNTAAVLRHFRWKVSFVKAEGEWLINNFESVAPVSAQAGPSTDGSEADGGDSQ